jgi:hypothetical protein
MTKEQIQQANMTEFMQYCRYHPRYFIEEFLKIQPKGEPLAKFILNPSQNMFMDIVERDVQANKPLRYIVCKNRQIGLSTLSEALVFWATVTNPSYHSLLVAPTRPRAQSLFEISSTFYDNMPDWIRPMRKYRTKNEFIFENPNEKMRSKNPGLSSSIRITPAKDLTAPRGLALSCAHLSEVPYYDEYMPDFYPALASAIPYKPKTIIIFESTPLGKGGYFHETYVGAKHIDAEDEEERAMWNKFTPVFLPWMIDPKCRVSEHEVTTEEKNYIMSHLDKYERELVEKFKVDVYQLAWRRREIKSNCNDDVTYFRRENPATEEEAFALSGTYFFTEQARNDYDKIKAPGKRGFLHYKGNPDFAATTIEFQESKDPMAPMELFHIPVRDEEYAMGVDPAYGMGRDYSAIVILNKKLQVCATFYSNEVPIDLFEDEVIKMHKLYNNAKLNLETTGPGNGMMFKLRKNIKPGNWWMWEKWDSPDKRRRMQSIGFDATNRSNSALDNLLTWVFNSGQLQTTSIDLIKEMQVYQYNEMSDRGMAAPGAHDDLMRALGLALLCLEDLGVINYKKKDIGGVWIKPDTGDTDAPNIGPVSEVFPGCILRHKKEPFLLLPDLKG